MRLNLSLFNVIVGSLGPVLALAIAPSVWAAPTYKVVHAFGLGQDGAGTWGSLILDNSGSLYGTTSGGGLFAYGTVFKLTSDYRGKWTESVLHNFNRDGQDGYKSTANLTFDTNGNLYGTTQGGGVYDAGTVFELTHGPSGWTENVLYSFGTRQHDAFNPYAGVTLDKAGNLYGTGNSVYQLSPDRQGGWKESIIHRFTRRHDGGDPFAGLILDQAGNLYGTSEGGGAYGAGTVYKLTPTGSGHWKERLLYSFCPGGPPCTDGGDPGLGALATDHMGDLYGTAHAGGANSCGEENCGTIFKLARGRHDQWTESVLYNFTSGSSGFGPGAGVVRDKAGNLYGTTIYGGSQQCDCGVVYKLSPTKNGKWNYTVLHTFVGSDGAQPDANLILDSKGNLYGTAATGGAYGAGVVFEITP